jgi:outer membrane receptor for ferric coprogen and ferric-rhodotorulic acid
VPEFSALTALQYKQPQGFFARAEWQWRGKTYFDETQNLQLSQNDYSLFNVRVGYSNNGYSGYLYVDNLGDNYYYTLKQGVRGVIGSPRVIGVQLTLSF